MEVAVNVFYLAGHHLLPYTQLTSSDRQPTTVSCWSLRIMPVARAAEKVAGLGHDSSTRTLECCGPRGPVLKFALPAG